MNQEFEEETFKRKQAHLEIIEKREQVALSRLKNSQVLFI